MPQQKARRHVLASPPRLCGSIRLFRNAVFRHNAITVDTVIPSSSTLVDRPPSLLPFPIVDQGQPLFLPESTCSHTDPFLTCPLPSFLHLLLIHLLSSCLLLFVLPPAIPAYASCVTSLSSSSPSSSRTMFCAMSFLS